MTETTKQEFPLHWGNSEGEEDRVVGREGEGHNKEGSSSNISQSRHSSLVVLYEAESVVAVEVVAEGEGGVGTWCYSYV